MRWPTKLLFLFFLLVTPLNLGAQALAYLDLASLGLGAALGAVHLRGGVEWPLDGGRSVTGEVGLYWSGTSGIHCLQGDLSGVVRWYPWEAQGLFCGAGMGLAVDGVSPGSLGTQALVLSEAGWTLVSPGSSLRWEPFVRGNLAIGSVQTRRASDEKGDWKWRATPSPAVGFRIGWSFSGPGGR